MVERLVFVVTCCMLFFSVASTNAELVAWYQLDEPNNTVMQEGTVIHDSSGDANNATMAWDTPSSPVLSSFTGSSLNFAGDSMRIWTPTYMGATGDFTWSVSIKTTQTANAGLINHSDDRWNHDNTNQCVGLVGGKVRFAMEGANWIQTEASVNDGAWHIITVVNYWENVCIFIDGQKAALDYAFGEGNNWFPGLATASDSFKYWLGACQWGGFVGEMKDVRIYDCKLSDREVALNAGRTDLYDPNLILQYKMNDAVGSGQFSDSSGSSYNGGIAWDTPTSEHISHFTGSSFSFENDSVRTFASKNLPISTKNPFTWAVWVKSTIGGTLFNRCAESNIWGWNIDGYKQFSLTTSPQFATAGLPFFSVVGQYPATGTISVMDGQWHHVAATFDGLGTTKIYIDGQFNTAQAQPLQDVNDDPNYMYFFGLGAGIRYIGEMADLRIYNKELSAEDMSALAVVGDFDGDRDVDYNDLDSFTGMWLDDYTATPFTSTAFENGDFEAYGPVAPDPNLFSRWHEYYYAAGYMGSTSNSQIALITNPADAHGGSQAMTWDYNSIDTSGLNYNYTEILYTLVTPITNVSNYDQMRVWIKRHAGNSHEGLLYMKILDGGVAVGYVAAESQLSESQGSSFANPDQWYEWIIDLNGLKFENGYEEITDLRAIMFGVSDDGGTGGTGTIDIDDITLVNLVACSVKKDQDLNYDCVINFADFAIFAQNWFVNK